MKNREIREIREVQDMSELKEVIAELPEGTMVIVEFGGDRTCNTD